MSGTHKLGAQPRWSCISLSPPFSLGTKSSSSPFRLGQWKYISRPEPYQKWLRHESAPLLWVLHHLAIDISPAVSHKPSQQSVALQKFAFSFPIVSAKPLPTPEKDSRGVDEVYWADRPFFAVSYTNPFLLYYIWECWKSHSAYIKLAIERAFLLKYNP